MSIKTFAATALFAVAIGQTALLGPAWATDEPTEPVAAETAVPAPVETAQAPSEPTPEAQATPSPGGAEPQPQPSATEPASEATPSSSPSPSPSATEPAEPEAEAASGSLSGQAIVGIKGNDRSLARDAISSYGGDVERFYGAGSFFVVETPTNAADWSRRMKWDSRIRYAEPDQVLAVDATPTDPRYGELWGMTTIGMPQAWGQHTGSRNVVVGVIDTGVAYNHEDLAAQMWKNPNEIAGNGIDEDKNGRVDDVYGNDCHNNDGNPLDDNDHGTHVAGTIGAAANNSVGVAGVNWNVQIMALKFLDSRGSGYTSNAIECIDYAIAKGADVLNNSWGGGGSSQSLLDAINRSNAAGQLFVAAAGNSAVNTDSSPHYPSSYAVDNVISVASTTSTDSLSSFSNYGVNSVDIAAPGSSILSTLRTGYGLMSGTSMATPHVAGAAALLAAANPDWSHLEIRDRLYETAHEVLALSGKVATGGRLDVGAAMTPEVPIVPDPVETGPVDALPTVQVTGPTATTVQGVVPVTATASDDVGVTQVEFLVDGASIGVDLNESDGWGTSWNTVGLTGAHNLIARATDSAGQTASSSPRNVTVNNAVMHVGDLDNTSYWYRPDRYWKGRIVVTVHDAFDQPLSGVAVYGTFSGGYSSSRSCTTSSAGVCTLTTSNISKNAAATTLTVTRLSRSGRTYTSNFNHDPESDSNGTVINAPRPL